MPIGNVNKPTSAKRETFRPPWVRGGGDAADTKKSGENDKAASDTKKLASDNVNKNDRKKPVDNGKTNSDREKTTSEKAPGAGAVAEGGKETPPPWATRKLRPVERPAAATAAAAAADPAPITAKLKPVLKKQASVESAEENGGAVTEDRLVKPSAARRADRAKNPDSNANGALNKPKETKENNMPGKPPLEKTNKLPPRQPSLKKQFSKDDIGSGVKKWRDPLTERKKENIDKTLANEIPSGHTLTKNESLRSLLKPTPPPMPPPLPPKMPPPPEFKKAPLDPSKLKKLESLRSRPRRRPDWSDMMKEVESGRKLKHVECNDRSQPIISRETVVKNKGQFIFESEKPNSHNQLLKEINTGVKLKKVKTNDRSKPNLEGLRKFRRQMTIEEQLQKSMSQANLAASPSSTGIAAEAVGALGVVGEVALGAAGGVEDDVDEMDDIDKVRDDLQSTKQLLAIELRNKEAQEREIKRLHTRISNLEAEVARERAIIKQEQHKTVISVTDAYDERLVVSLKGEVEKARETAEALEKKYLAAAEERDAALSDLEELKRKNAELEKKLDLALSNALEYTYESEEPMSFYEKRQREFAEQCRLLNIDVDSSEARELTKSLRVINNLNANAYTNNYYQEGGGGGGGPGSRRASHAAGLQSQDSFREDELSDEDEDESEEKKQKRKEKEVKNMRNKIQHLKEKQDTMKRERMALKMSLKNQQAALKEEKRKYKELKREVNKMAAMMKEVGSDEEEEDDEEGEEEEEDAEKCETEEESETETEQDTESETESESEPEDADVDAKRENLSGRVKRHEGRVAALKKGNTLLLANVERLRDDVARQRDLSADLQQELDALIRDLD